MIRRLSIFVATFVAAALAALSFPASTASEAGVPPSVEPSPIDARSK
jgi:hypothetical protein